MCLLAICIIHFGVLVTHICAWLFVGLCSGLSMWSQAGCLALSVVMLKVIEPSSSEGCWEMIRSLRYCCQEESIQSWEATVISHETAILKEQYWSLHSSWLSIFPCNLALFHMLMPQCHTSCVMAVVV